MKDLMGKVGKGNGINMPSSQGKFCMSLISLFCAVEFNSSLNLNNLLGLHTDNILIQKIAKTVINGSKNRI